MKTVLSFLSSKNKLPQRISQWVTRQLDRWQVPAEIVLLGTSLLVGLGAGVGAVVFRHTPALPLLQRP